jgi:P27 family predicted phage terminase small subunit
MKKRPIDSPKHLSTEAKGWWERIVGRWELDDAALLILEGALEAFDRMREAQAVLKKEGVVTTDRFGKPRQHPATLVERDAKNALLKGIKALGLELEPLNDRPGRPLGR